MSYKFKALAFRLRVWIFALLYVLGFWTPWERFLSGARASTLWLAASTLLARTGWCDLAKATEAVTIMALCCCFAGAALRLWGTAYLGASVMRDVAMRGDHVVAAGPYRRLRNPLYAATFVFSLGVSILMPPSGALFFLLGIGLFQLLLISGEEDFLARRQGDLYNEYRRRVPRLLPSLSPRVAASEATPRWLQALLAEIFPAGYSLCFAVLAWRYNALILIQCLIVCFGISIVIRAGLASTRRAGA